MNKITIVSDAKNTLEGWYCAIMLKHQLHSTGIDIEHIYDEPLSEFEQFVCLNEHSLGQLINSSLAQALLLEPSQTQLVLAQQYQQWGTSKTSFYHADAPLGVNKNGVLFHHLLTKYLTTEQPFDFSDLSLNLAAAKKDKPVWPSRDKRSIFSSVNIALNIPHSYLLKILKAHAQKLGVKAYKGQVVTSNSHDNVITELQLSDGNRVTADFYIDLNSYHAQHLLSRKADERVKPFTNLQPQQVKYTSHDAKPDTAKHCHTYQSIPNGWQRSAYLGARQYIAQYTLAPNNEQQQPNTVSFTFYNQAWQGNCLCLGASSYDAIDAWGEQLPLVDQQLSQWLAHFPNKQPSEFLIKAYNQKNNDMLFHRLVMSRIPFWFVEHGHGGHQKVPEDERVAKGSLSSGDDLIKMLLNTFYMTGTLPALEHIATSSEQWINFLFQMGEYPRQYSQEIAGLSASEVTQHINKIRKAVVDTTSAL